MARLRHFAWPFWLAPASRAALALALFRAAAAALPIMIALDAHDRKDQDRSGVRAIEGETEPPRCRFRRKFDDGRHVSSLAPFRPKS